MTTSLLSAAANLLGLAAISALTLLTMLILRNPFLPKRLQNEGVAHAVSLVLTAGVFIAVMDAVAGLDAADFHYGTIAVIVAGALAGPTYVLWKLFDIGGRLAQAEAGQSPFAQRQPVPAAVALDSAPTGG